MYVGTADHLYYVTLMPLNPHTCNILQQNIINSRREKATDSLFRFDAVGYSPVGVSAYAYFM